MATKIAGLPIQKEWTVTDVREGNETPSDHGGTLKAFYVDFAGAPDVYWRRKMPATVEVGKSYFGTISEGQHGPVFKKESPQGGGGGSRGGSSGGGARSSGSSGGRPYKPEAEFDPEKVARIGRAHAQSCAVETVIARQEIAGEADEVKSTIKAWTDFFASDVDQAGRAARSATPPQSAPAAPAAQRPAPAAGNPKQEDGWREKFRALLETKALEPYPAGKLADFIMRLSETDQRRAWNDLSAFETEMQTLKELEEGFAKAEGEPLPKTPGGATEDDIPF